MTARPAWLSEVEPLYEGVGGKAWKFPLPADSDDPRLAIALDAHYLIFAPGAHPFWSWHLLMLISLAEAPGVDAPHKQYPEAAYELMVVALDPKLPPPDPRVWPLGATPPTMSILTPPDAVVQFHGVNDEQAVSIAAKAAEACAIGVLIPDSDHREAWELAITGSAQHLSGGFH